MKNMAKKIILTICIIIGFTIMSFSVNAKTITVGNDQDYQTIQNAVDIASDRDTIYVLNGIYTGNIEIDKSITLEGQDKENTIIDGNSYGTCIEISVDDVIITNFTIQNSGSFTYDAGIGIFGKAIDFIENCIIENNIIKNNLRYGLSLSCCKNNIIRNNIFENNSHEGIQITYQSNNNTIINNNFKNNRYGISIEATYCCNNIFYHNNFIENWHFNAHDGLMSYDYSNNKWVESINNSWYNEEIKEGNYWSDYNGSDLNGDGVGDTVYKNIYDGSSQSTDRYKKDLYPLMEIYIPTSEDTSDSSQNNDNSQSNDNSDSELDGNDNSIDAKKKKKNNTPGFELFTLLIASTIFYIFYRKKECKK